MRHALALSLVALFLGGCASNPADRDISGTWINQVAIDAASKGGPLREALQAYGPNLEWDVNTKASQARYTNGFENVDGKLLGEASGAWKVDFYGSSASELKRDGKQLSQAASDNEPAQVFDRALIPCRMAHRLARASNARCIRPTWAVAGKSSAVPVKAAPCSSRPMAK
jgi:hypothetical protein